MDKLVAQDSAQAGDESLDYGIRDLEVVIGLSGIAVFASSGSYGGLSGYRLDSQGRLTQTGEIDFVPTQSAGLATEMTVIDTGGGNLRMIVGGTGAGRIMSYDITETGQISDARVMGGTDAGIGVIGTALQTDQAVLLANPWSTGFSSFTLTGNRLNAADVVTDTSSSYGFGVRDIIVLEQGGREFVLTAAQGTSSAGWSLDETGITSYEMVGSDPQLRDTFGAVDGLGLMVPNDMTVADVGGQQFAIVASASPSGQAGALSVIGISTNGGLRLVDHASDTRDTRFASTQAVESITHEGRAYVVAGGGDDGVSLFTMTPSGKLILLDSFADTLETGLDGITALELAVHNETLHIFVASQSDAGISHLTFDVEGQGVTRLASAGGGLINGSNGNDLIEGGSGNDSIVGFGGNDILSDGAGSDTLQGGSGADLFVLQADDMFDRINDFNVNQDQLDLSNWAYFTDPDDLVLQRITNGIRVTFGDEVLNVMQAGSVQIGFDDFRDAVVRTPSRIFEVPAVLFSGGGGDEQIIGDWAADTLRGGGGDDTLRGGLGDDRFQGGTGQDLIDGGGGIDTAEMEVSQRSVNDVTQLGANRIEITTTRGVDTYVGVEWFVFSDGILDFDAVVNLSRGLTLSGSGANNVINGSTGHDTIFGGAGRDTLNGLGGNDVLEGGTGDDRILGGAGTDRAILSVSQAEVTGIIRLSSTSIQINSHQGRDVFEGVEFFEFLDGTFTLAQMTARETGRVVSGGSGNDSLLGGLGEDTLSANGGNDRLDGGAGNDVLRGGSGQDILFGRSGNDTLSGGRGNDTLSGGGGTDVVEVLASLRDLDVRILDDGQIQLQSADGTDIVDGVEWFSLSDAWLSLAQIRALVGSSGSGGTGDTDVDPGIAGISLTGDSGQDRLIGTNNNDTLNGRGGDDTLEGARGHDTLDGGTGSDSIKGGTGNDRIIGGWGNDTLAGGKGDDVIYGNSGENRLLGQADNDSLYGGVRDDNLKGGGGADLLVGDDGNDFLKGGTHNDTVEGGNGNDAIAGNRHDDRLSGGQGNDKLNGGGDNDTLNGGQGNDTLKGGEGADEFVFYEGGNRDQILDFDVRSDTLRIHAELVSGQQSGSAVLNAYAEVTAQGVVLDFGGGDLVILSGVQTFGSLANDIEVF